MYENPIQNLFESQVMRESMAILWRIVLRVTVQSKHCCKDNRNEKSQSNRRKQSAVITSTSRSKTTWHARIRNHVQIAHICIVPKTSISSVWMPRINFSADCATGRTVPILPGINPGVCSKRTRIKTQVYYAHYTL